MLRLVKTFVPVAGLALLWWLLSDGEPGSWLVGVPAILAAAWAGRRFGADDSGISVAGAFGFLSLFMWESLRGGLDVARRVLGVRLRVRPGFIRYRILLHDPRARLLFVNSVSLVPGTLAVDLQDDRLRVHALDTSTDLTDELRRLERAVGRMYREVTWTR